MTEGQRVRIGIVGMGRMGAAVGARLVTTGHNVACCDLLPARRATAEAAGACWLESAGAVAAAADVVITLLPGAREVQAVAGELVDAMSAGTLWIEMSTAAPGVARLITVAAARQEVHVVDAPVGGGPAAAAEGRLVIFAGGSAEDVASARVILSRLAEPIVHVGPPGSGYAVKLLANTLWFGQAVAVAEALTAARRAGLDAEVVRSALAQSAAASRFLSDDAPALLDGDDLTSFALARCCEQLAAVSEWGEELSVPMELTAVVAALHHRALARYGDVDGELLGARFVAERGGVTFGGTGACDRPS